MEPRRTRHPIGRLLACVTSLALVMTLGASSTTAASPTACRVANTETGKTYTALQSAVDAASDGDRLTVRGVCRGGALIDRDLVIAGVHTSASGRPTLSGARKARVLVINRGVRVRLRDLVIKGGRALIPQARYRDHCARGALLCGRRGGGINNRGDLTLRDVVVRDNKAAWEGGGVSNKGSLTLNGSSRIGGNDAITSDGQAGGVLNWDGSLTLNDSSSISGNTSRTSMGGVYNRSGSVTLNDSSSISGNTARGSGGGIFNVGSLTLNDSSSVTGNRAPSSGGISNNGKVTLNGTSRVSDNIGPGIDNWGHLTLNDSSSVTGNSGRGIHNVDTLVMNDQSSVTGNSGRAGGGVSNAGTITMRDSSSIHSNVAYPDENGVPGLGGGLYNTSGGILVGVNCAPQTHANVYGNTPDDCYIEP